MSELKTKANDADVEAFLAGVDNDQRRQDTRQVMAVMARVSGEPPRMWGNSLIGFGSYHYVYASKREGDWPLTAVSPRKQALSIYIMPGFDAYGGLMAKLGKYKTGRSCLYVKKLEDVNPDVLEELIRRSVTEMRRRYPSAS